ncbi:MAG: response regulator transcription factor [Alistipes sp.]|nr:response regulator transcription factor [Alistipes sp.]
MPHRILLVDDEPDIIEFVRYNLLREGYEVFTAPNGAEALRVAAECRPHLILLDRMMPVMDGAETCRAIRRDPELRSAIVVFLSALGEEEQQLTGFGAGADDYLVKPIRMKLLVSRVRAILKRVDEKESAEAAVEAAGIEIDRERYTVRCDGREIALPRKEFALLDLLSSAPGKLVPREEIYARIWGSEVVVGDRTIDVHIRKLRQKIGEHRITTVKGVGYRFEP